MIQQHNSTQIALARVTNDSNLSESAKSSKKLDILKNYKNSIEDKFWFQTDYSNFDLSNTNLKSFNFRRKSKLDHDKQIEKNICKNILPGSNIEKITLQNTNCNGANLEEASLFQADVRDTDFTGANLFAANLVGTQLLNTNLTGANLCMADLSKTRHLNTNFTRAHLYKADLNRIIRNSDTNFKDAILLHTKNADPSLIARARSQGAITNLDDLKQRIIQLSKMLTDEDKSYFRLLLKIAEENKVFSAAEQFQLFIKENKEQLKLLLLTQKFVKSNFFSSLPSEVLLIEIIPNLLPLHLADTARSKIRDNTKNIALETTINNPEISAQNREVRSSL